MANIFAHSIALQATSAGMLVTGADIFTNAGVRQSTPTSAYIITTPPTFAGIAGLTGPGGIIQATWLAATAGNGIITYDVYIKKDTAVNLFLDTNKVLAVLTLSAYITFDSSGNPLVPNATYYVGVRARDALSNYNTNTASLSVVYTPDTLLAASDIPLIASTVWESLRAAHTLSGTFGAALQGVLSVTRANNLDNLDATITSRASQTIVDYIHDDTNYLQAGLTAGRMNNLDNLNAQITTRAAASTMAAEFALTAKDATVAKAAALTGVSSQVTGVASQVTGVQNTANTILGQTGTTGVKVDAADQAAIVDKVWDEATSAHVIVGSTGAALTTAASAAAATITGADLQNIADKVWNEPKASHAAAGTMGEAQGVIAGIQADTTTLTGRLTAPRAAQLDNLDVAVSTRESEASASARAGNDLSAHATTQSAVASVYTGVGNANTSLGTLTSSVASVKVDTVAINTKTTNLPSDPAGNASVTAIVAPVLTAATTAASNSVAIKAKTDNLPAVPASESTVLLIPTNPLLSSDTRLNRLDVNVSSRAAPSDLSALATSAQLGNAQSAIQSDIAGVETTLSGKPSTAALAAAVAPLALEATSATILTEIGNVQSGVTTPADIWSYTTRGLTEPVDANVDVSGLATSAELAMAKDEIITEQKVWEAKLGATINPVSDTIDFTASLTKNAQLLVDATSASVEVLDVDDNLIFTLGPILTSGTDGVFKLTRANASVVLAAGNIYSCHVTVVHNSISYKAMVPLTVF